MNIYNNHEKQPNEVNSISNGHIYKSLSTPADYKVLRRNIYLFHNHYLTPCLFLIQDTNKSDRLNITLFLTLSISLIIVLICPCLSVTVASVVVNIFNKLLWATTLSGI